MQPRITFFTVDNGDMTLIRLVNETNLLIDVNIRQAADDPNDNTRDVAKDLRERIKRDNNGRPYIDAFLLTHPDKDHCTGLINHFYLGSLEDYPDDDKKDEEKKIIIREIWSSPMVFRRASKNHILCDDAKAFNKEAKRRVKINRENHFTNMPEGDRILILGEDKNGKTDDLGPILIKTDETFSRINGITTSYLECRLLAPSQKQNDEVEELLSKNHSSVILNIKIAASEIELDGCRFLVGGDAEVAIWERLWERYKNNSEALTYDLLLAPHHCSWHTLSYDSWSEKGEGAKVSADAHSALSQTRGMVAIVSSSKPILDDDRDPPCIRAKREYQEIASNVDGRFYCIGEYPKSTALQPLEFDVTVDGISEVKKVVSAPTILVSSPAPRAG